MIDIVHTPCKSCVFAVYQDKTQTECALGYLQTYKEKNQEILEVYDEDLAFFVINKKKCPGYREQKWFDSLQRENSTLEEKISLFHEYNHIDFLLIINLLHLNRNQFVDICEQISSLQISPNKIVFVRYPPSAAEDIFPYEYLKEHIDNYLGQIVWRIQTVVDASISYEFMLQNIVSVNKKYRFVASISSHNEDIANIVDCANKIVVSDLGSFLILSNKDKTSLLFSSVVYRYSMFMDNKNILTDEDSYKYI